MSGATAPGSGPAPGKYSITRSSRKTDGLERGHPIRVVLHQHHARAAEGEGLMQGGRKRRRGIRPRVDVNRVPHLSHDPGLSGPTTAQEVDEDLSNLRPTATERRVAVRLLDAAPQDVLVQDAQELVEIARLECRAQWIASHGRIIRLRGLELRRQVAWLRIGAASLCQPISDCTTRRADDQTNRRPDGYLKWVDEGEGREPTTLRARLSSHLDRRGAALGVPPRSARAQRSR